MRRMTMLAVTLLLLLVTAQSGLAHRPENGNPEGVTIIPDPTTSYAYYRQLSGSDTVHVYQFEGQAGTFFHAGINIPQLDRLADYGVSLALLGPGLPPLAPAKLPFQQISARMGMPTLLPDWARTASQPTLSGIRVDSTPGEAFFEPFTQTRYWGRQELELDLPQDGSYTLLIWHEGGQPGKYVLDTGTQEVFGPGDLLQFPLWWFNTRTYFEQGPFLTTIAAAITTLALAGLVSARRIHATRRAK